MNKMPGGFTLLELMLAVVILTVAVLGAMSSTGSVTSRANSADLNGTVLQAIEDQLTTLALDPRRSSLDSLYQGVEVQLAELPGFKRVTEVDVEQMTLDGGRSVLYQKVTVSVSGPGLPDVVSRTRFLPPF